MADAVWDVKGALNLEPLKKAAKSSADILTGYPDALMHPARQFNEDQLKILRRHAPGWIGQGPKAAMDIARKLTYGDSDTPARPFLEEGILADKDEISDLAAAFFKGAVDGMNNDNAAEAVGAACVGAVKEFMLQTNTYRESAPNSWLTIAVKSRSQQGSYKLSDQPLVDTGLLAQLTTFVVKRGWT